MAVKLALQKTGQLCTHLQDSMCQCIMQQMQSQSAALTSNQALGYVASLAHERCMIDSSCEERPGLPYCISFSDPG